MDVVTAPSLPSPLHADTGAPRRSLRVALVQVRWLPDPDEHRGQLADGIATAAWRPVYLDYLYVALTNMMAFSPTDTMPMTVRAKMIMAYQSIGGFILLALVISRAVNIIS